MKKSLVFMTTLVSIAICHPIDSTEPFARKSIPRTVLKLDQERIKPLLEPIQGKVREEGGKYYFTFQDEGPSGRKRWLIYTPPNMIDPVVVASVEQNSHGAYTYYYELRNLETSRQALSGFWVSDAVGQAIATVPPNSNWHAWVRKGNPEDHRFPGNWQMFTTTQKYAIKPGAVMKGITIITSGLPGIVPCYLYGYSKSLENDGKGEFGEVIYQALDVICGGQAGFVGSRGKTLGPVPIPKGTPSELIEKVCRMIEESFEMGWMDEKATKDAINARLKQANDWIKASQIQKAKTELNQIIAFVNQEVNKKVAVEVQSIVQYNLEYILKQM